MGRETYENRLSVGLGLFLAPVIDLWPFDDGINVLGLIVLGANPDRHEAHSAETAYFRKSLGADAPLAPEQETVILRVIPLSLGVGKRVLARDATPR